MSIHLKSATAALVLGAATLYASSSKDIFNQGVLPNLEKAGYHPRAIGRAVTRSAHAPRRRSV